MKIPIADGYPIIDLMTLEILARIKAWSGEEKKNLYRTRVWQKIAKIIKAYDRNECVCCREAGKHSAAQLVHHVKNVKEHSDLALSTTYTEDGKVYRQLVSVCKQCHEREHEKDSEMKVELTIERW